MTTYPTDALGFPIFARLRTPEEAERFVVRRELAELEFRWGRLIRRQARERGRKGAK